MRRSGWTSVSRVAWRSRRAPAADAARQHRRQQAPQRALDVADQLDLGLVGGVDLGRLGVDVDDPLAAVGVPARPARTRPGRSRRDTTRSARSKPERTWSRAWSPTAISERWLRSSMAPLPMNVTATGTWRPLANARSSLEARPAQHAVAGQDDRPRRGRQEPSGVLDRLVGRLGEVGPVGASGREVVGDLGGAARFSGSSMWVGPGFSSWATRNALRTISGMASTRSTRWFHFVTGSNMRTMSTNWCASLWSLSSPVWPVIGDHRRAVEEGVGDAGHEVGGTRPERRHRHRGAAGQATVDVGHERGALLVAGRDVADGVLPAERVEDVHRLLARHREDVLAALGFEALDEQGGGGPGSVGHARQSTGQAVRDGRSGCPGRRHTPLMTGTLLRLAAFTTDPSGGNPAGVWIGEVLPAGRRDAADRRRGRLFRVGFPGARRFGRRPGGSGSATSARWPRSRSVATRRSPAASRSRNVASRRHRDRWRPSRIVLTTNGGPVAIATAPDHGRPYPGDADVGVDVGARTGPGARGEHAGAARVASG